MYMHSSLSNNIIYLKFEEHCSVELVAKTIKASGDILAKDSDAQNGWNVILGERAKSGFGDLGIEA